MYYSLPSNRVKGLLQFLSDGSGFSSIGVLGSSGVAMGFAHSMFSFLKTDPIGSLKVLLFGHLLGYLLGYLFDKENKKKSYK